jgi:hypothetical protein
VSGIVLIAAVLAVAAAAAQQPQPSPDQKPKPGSDKNVVVVRGCISGSILTKTTPREYVLVIPSTLHISGNRAMRGQLKEVNGHTVELTGTLKGLTNLATGALVKDTGKTKIYVGGTERRMGDDAIMDQQRINPPTLDVSSVKDIAPQCQEPGEFD